MTIKTEMAFYDILRLSCGVPQIVLQNIADAHREQEYMEILNQYWGDKNPCIAQLLQWTALTRFFLYERLRLDEDGKRPECEYKYEDEDEWGYTRDAEDVYRW